jgi:hypothetical protein
MPHATALGRRMTAALGMASAAEVLRLLPLEPDPEAEGIAFHHMARKGIRDLWPQIVQSVPVTAAARATNLLEYLIKEMLPVPEDEPMSEPDTKRVYAILSEIVSGLTPDQRAKIRSTPASLPYAAVVALSRVPREESEHPEKGAVWISAIRGLAAELQHGGPGIGRVLAETDYPVPRLERLLSATGSAYVGQMDEAIRWLVTRGRPRANLTDLVALGLSDDPDTRFSLRLRIARDFARAEAQAH